ncbi:diguanylate cyclase [Martelella radicis]|uniref:diguanylate cyclase n=1 Tax=Martelella radicis TaxID=1397476 RepID=A0A7W6KHN8_9HYPH|nr:diguanylate cyclase [Martelella radicis]
MGALIVMGYGMVLRHFRGKWYEDYASAVVLACGALAAMTNPIVLETGYIFDARAVFIALAGPFAGPGGAVLVAACTALPRIMIGGDGMMAGVAGIIIAAAAGIIFTWIVPQKRTPGSFLLLGCLAALMVLSLFLLEFHTALALMESIGFTLTLVNILGIVLLGSALEATKRSADYLRDVEFNAERDPLTGLYNRRALEQFEHSLGQSVAPDKRFGCVVLFDIDRFKSVNDRYGHARGDEVLQRIANTVTSRMRRSDLVVRYGGEEIAVVLLSTSVDDAFRIAEHIRSLVEKLVFSHQRESFSVTISAGIAAFTVGETQLEEAFDYADRALYQAKNAGRNRTEILNVPVTHEVPVRANA